MLLVGVLVVQSGIYPVQYCREQCVFGRLALGRGEELQARGRGLAEDAAQQLVHVGAGRLGRESREEFVLVLLLMRMVLLGCCYRFPDVHGFRLGSPCWRRFV